MNKAHEYYDRFMKSLNKLSDEEIVDEFNREVGNGGWGTARASFLGALHKQFRLRNLDYSEIGDQGSYSLSRKVKLVGKTIKVIPNSEPKVLQGGIYKVEFDDKEENGFKLTPYDKRSTLF